MLPVIAKYMSSVALAASLRKLWKEHVGLEASKILCKVNGAFEDKLKNVMVCRNECKSNRLPL